MVEPLKYLKSRINEIQKQYNVCRENDCDVSEVKSYLLEYKYAYQLLKDFGFVNKKQPEYKYNLAHKLTISDVKYIRKFYNKDAGKYAMHSAHGLARIFKVHITTIKNIIAKKTWKDVA